ncbi:MAG: hypothetical protein LBC49_02745 [Bacteroidales bacterium]|jgi:hypothetical protein|nr:hypothetical protein [Bacteroidales bacterium]
MNKSRKQFIIHTLIFTCIGTLFINTLKANDTVIMRNGFKGGWMKSVPYNKSFWAENTPSFFRIDFAHLSNHSEYDVTESGKKMRTYIFANMGANIPIWSGDIGGNKNGNYSIALSCPIIVEVWLDIITHSSPLINTSYRVSAPTLTFLHKFGGTGSSTNRTSRTSGTSGTNRIGSTNRSGGTSGTKDAESTSTTSTTGTAGTAGSSTKTSKQNFLKNYSITLSPFRHESTHIGDELMIFRMENGLPIRRINVSYNCTELAFTLNAPTTDREENHAFRLGFFAVHNFPGEKSYYMVFGEDVNPDYSDIDPDYTSQIKPAKGDYEWYIQYQFQSKPIKHFQFIASTELRNRARYNYPMQIFTNQQWNLTDAAYSREWCINAFAGVRYSSLRDTYFSRIGVGLSAYYGINPYGQFRNYNNFQQYGLSIIFE